MGFRVKLLEPNARIPKKAHATDAAFDLYSNEGIVLPPNSMITVGTGVSVEIVPGYVGLVFSRSGHGKKRISLANCVGVIDSGYMGEIKVMLENLGNESYAINVGDRIAQLAIMPVSLMDLEEETKLTREEWESLTPRGSGGFGSSGVK